MARPSELCLWCKHLIETAQITSCTAGKNPFRWVISCSFYAPKSYFRKSSHSL
jgi:hypothetical protein